LLGEVKTNPQKLDETKLRGKAQVFLQEQKLSDYSVELRAFSVQDMFGA